VSLVRKTSQGCVPFRRAGAALVLLALGMPGCSLVGRRPLPAPGSRGAPVEVGTASWYGPGFEGRQTASGERFDQRALSAASCTLPLGSRARVTNLANGRSVVVRVNDRGPYVRGRVLDVSSGAARRLGFVQRGTTRVRIEALAGPGPTPARGHARRRRPHRPR
jgi:peptidoglycan lytic transglycosylase